MLLASAGWELALLPALGGAIGALRHRGADILRPAVEGVADPLATACVPLVPYANRIADGRFAFGGRRIALPRNFGDHPHSLHGLGWQRPWTVVEAGADRARLAHDHDGTGGWPWAYRAEQVFALDGDGLCATLTVTNLADEPMPAGIGFHPYFPLSPRTRLRFAADRVWLAGPTRLPTEPAPAGHFRDWAAGAPAAGAPFVDNSYEGWNGGAVIDQGDRLVLLSAQGARDLHLFLPGDEAIGCLEPVSHLPDAFNRPGSAFDILPPGGSLTLAMRIAVEPA